MKNFIAVIIGGSCGAALRYLSIIAFSKAALHGYNFATLLINAIGCFFAGFIFSYTEINSADSIVRIFFITGLIGAYTTLAAYGIECISYLKSGNWFYFALNLILTNLISIFMIWLGFKAAESLK